MEILLTYLIEKGGALGLMLAISIAWIVFREKNHYNNPDLKKSKDLEEIQKSVEKIEQHLKSVGEIISSSKFDTILSHLNALREDLDKLTEETQDLEGKLEDLWNWHNVRDHDGVPVWYLRKSFEESIISLQESIGKLKVNFLDVNQTTRTDLEEKLQKSNDSRVSELKKVLESYNKTVTELAVALEKIRSVLESEDFSDD